MDFFFYGGVFVKFICFKFMVRKTQIYISCIFNSDKSFEQIIFHHCMCIIVALNSKAVNHFTWFKTQTFFLTRSDHLWIFYREKTSILCKCLYRAEY